MKWLAVALLALFSSWVVAEEKILSFKSQIQIAADGELTVTETIDIQVEGVQVKRGILRDFPTDYRDRFERRVTVPFDVVGVKRDGAPEPWSAGRQANGVSLRIGNPNVMLNRGRHLYEITYRTRFQVGFFDAHDELYWNVNGNGWTFAMDAISAEVTLPAAVPAAQLKVEAYTGPFGARGRDYAAEARDGGANFRTTRRLGTFEGLTIVFMFPKGIVAPPSLRVRLDRWLQDNFAEAVGLAGLLVLAAFLYWRWSVVGRDPRTGPPFPRYEPPRGLGPAGARFLDKMAVDDRCFAVALLGLGQRGYLRIRQTAGGFFQSARYRLEPTGKSVDWLPGEKSVAALVSNGSRDLGHDYDPEVSEARTGVAAELTAHYGEKLFSRNKGSQTACFVIGAATMAAMFFLGAALAAMLVVGLVVVFLLAAAVRLMPAYTVEGRRLEDEVEGLRQYLSVAEGDDLKRMKIPPRTKEEFARFLPYAVALDVEKTWADAFARVLGASALAAATADYYQSSSGDAFRSAGDFTHSIATMGRTISAASTPPGSSSGSSDSGGSSSSSGSSGGGSSGGGGGGGGGSGW